MAVTDDAITKIKQMIVDGELTPGAKLPREGDLAERLGLSRNSLREAVRALSLIHVLDVRQGDGTYVTSLDPHLLLSAMEFVVDFHHDDTVLHFLEVRRILEPAATAAAATKMTDAELQALAAHLDNLPADPTPEELVDSDLVFHRAIAKGSGNPVLASLLETIAGPTHRARMWRGLTQQRATEQTIREHHQILSGLQARQPDIAAAAAVVHIAGVEEWLRRAAAAEPAPIDGPNGD